MSDNRLTILAIFAHPDDEIGAGSTLARYGDAGVHTVLVCASRGEAATIYCDECATRENLAEVRTRELECACGHLGIDELRWLDWPDGDIQALPRPEAVGQVVAQIRDVRPNVIITHPENGLYPHPDHLAVWEIVRTAYDVAADPTQYPEAGPAWPASRLYTRALPQSFFDAVPAFAEYRVRLQGQLLPFLGTPDDQIDVTMHVEPWAERRMAAWDCHRSQHNPNGAFTQMPEEMRRAMAENEHFVLAVARIPIPEDTDDDLLAGLEHGQPVHPVTPQGLVALRASLAAHRGSLAVCEDYSRQTSEPGFRALLGDLAENHREAIYLLARALRQADETAGDVEVDAQVIARASQVVDTAARADLLAVGAAQALATYRRQAETAAIAEERALWEELAAAAEAQSRQVHAFRQRS